METGLYTSNFGRDECNSNKIEEKREKLYLPTLTLSTEADFHRGRVRRLKITVVGNKLL
jgi:hypothetical protein